MNIISQKQSQKKHKENKKMPKWAFFIFE